MKDSCMNGLQAYFQDTAVLANKNEGHAKAEAKACHDATFSLHLVSPHLTQEAPIPFLCLLRHTEGEAPPPPIW